MFFYCITASEHQGTLMGFIDTIRGASDRFHVLKGQLIGGEGVGKTNTISWLAEKCFPDYKWVYTRAPSFWEQIRIMNNLEEYIGDIKGQAKFFFVIDDPSFLFTSKMSQDHDWEIFQNEITRVRHRISKQTGVYHGDVRIVVIFAHHYINSIGPYLRETPVQLLGSLWSDEQLDKLGKIFKRNKLKKFYRLYDAYIKSQDSLLSKKTYSPFLCKIITSHYILRFPKAGIDITEYQVNEEQDRQEPLSAREVKKDLVRKAIAIALFKRGDILQDDINALRIGNHYAINAWEDALTWMAATLSQDKIERVRNLSKKQALEPLIKK